MNTRNEYYKGAFCTIHPKRFKKELGTVTGKNVKVAVIDSGWNYLFRDSRIRHGIGLISDEDELEFAISDDYNDRVGHGTAVTDLILQISPDVSIYPVRIFGSRLETSIDILVESIKWSIHNKINVINLSLGTLLPEALEPLYRMCEIARRKGIIIVASKSNSKDWSYPAIFENSIGVASDDFNSSFDYKFDKNNAIECLTKGNNQNAFYRGMTREYLSGNSFATPNITGIISLILEKHPGLSLEDTRNLLSLFST